MASVQLATNRICKQKILSSLDGCSSRRDGYEQKLINVMGGEQRTLFEEVIRRIFLKR